MNNKTTRSSKLKEMPARVAVKAPALRKVMFISHQLLEDPSNELKLEYFYHPGREKLALFITKANRDLMEVLEFSEPRRCWLINNDVCSNGRIYMTIPVDITFLALHHLRKHCTEKAMSLDTIGDSEDKSTLRLLREFVHGEKDLRCVADIKTASGMVFYKYNPNRTLAWLAIKARRVAEKLRNIGSHCGKSAVSQNYIRGEIGAEGGEDTEMDYLREACDIIGGYLDLDLHEELKKYLKISAEKPLAAARKDKKEIAGKRKSLQQLNSNENKKMKITDDAIEGSGSVERCSLNDKSSAVESGSDEISPVSIVETIYTPSPVKERNLTAKEKALAKSAKGTKSISAFFSKK